MRRERREVDTPLGESLRDSTERLRAVGVEQRSAVELVEHRGRIELRRRLGERRIDHIAHHDVGTLCSELGDEALERKLALRIKRFKFSNADVAEIVVTYPIDFLPS